MSLERLQEQHVQGCSNNLLYLLPILLHLTPFNSIIRPDQAVATVLCAKDGQ